MCDMQTMQQQRIAHAKSKVDGLNKEISLLVQKRDRYARLLESIEKENILQRVNDRAGGALEDQIDFYLNIENITDGTLYRKAVYFWRSIGLSLAGGQFYSTKQVVIQIGLNQDGSNIEEIHDSLSVVEPFVKEIKGDFKVFYIIKAKSDDPECFRLYKMDGDWFVGGEYTKKQKFENLKKALAFVAENHYC
ncbi:hypothetical protein PHYNN_215 [Pantoea phage Phynn]|nr:hypothetical protein PHYNN_215 [Pantoea phage Phynn]